jgi:hypothetical protein
MNFYKNIEESNCELIEYNGLIKLFIDYSLSFISNNLLDSSTKSLKVPPLFDGDTCIIDVYSDQYMLDRLV